MASVQYLTNHRVWIGLENFRNNIHRNLTIGFWCIYILYIYLKGNISLWIKTSRMKKPKDGVADTFSTWVWVSEFAHLLSQRARFPISLSGNLIKFPLVPMEVLAPGSAHARPYALPPINTSGNFSAQVSGRGDSQKKEEKEKTMPLTVDT